MINIVQSYWNLNSEKNCLLQNGGFLCPEIHWMAWAFSCLQLRKFYKDVELHTNEAGKQVFELLKIPYSKIHVSMETEFMQNLHPDMWAYAKINTYSIQKEPFLHVDGDVFIWKAFENSLLESPLIAQNIEDNLKFYHQSIEIIENNAAYVPSWISSYKHHPKAYNAGILGGNHIDFIKEYTRLAFEYYNNNYNRLSYLTDLDKNLNIISEQYLFYVLSEQQKVPVSLFFNKNVCTQNDFAQFYQINKIPHSSQFCHLLGDVKKSSSINSFVSFLLQNDYPEYWQKIINVFSERGILSDYMKRQLQMQESKRYKVLPQSVDTKDIFHDTKALCKLLKVDFEMIEETVFENSMIKELYKLETKKLEFEKKEFDLRTNSSVQFPTYRMEYCGFNLEDIEKSYILISPYHTVIITNYDWKKVFTESFSEKTDNYYPYKLNVLYILDCSNFIINIFYLSDFFLHIFEIIKSRPITIKELMKRYISQNESILELLNLWYALGVIYLSKSKKDFILQEPSVAYVLSQNNLKLQISSCLYYVLNHYKVTNYKSKLIQKYENTQKSVSLYELVQVIEKLGFEAKGVRGTIESLLKIPLPAIVILKLRDYLPLYVIITKATNTYITVYNTEILKEEIYPISYFSTIWDGNLVLILPR